MCGIFGIYSLRGESVDPAHLAAMGRVIPHRGPDDQGIHADGQCGIGMRRLSIIDLAGGHQPIANADGTVWVVCNGEIYNFRELRRELQTLGCQFKTASDTEAILHAYLVFGDSFLARLNGMYAFALWDSRVGRLLIVRDRLGVKPIYYLNDGSRIAFASELKSLLELPGVCRRLNDSVLPTYLELGYVPAPHTMLDGVRKVPVASVMDIRGRDVTLSTYWQPPEAVDHTRSDGEWCERIRSQLERSVRMQMVSDVPIGAFLSGGVDSSAVLAFMARSAEVPVRTYSIGFAGSAASEYFNELPYARRVASAFGTDHHEIMVSPDVIGLLPRLLWHLDEPIADTAFLTTYLVAEFARRQVTVILSGVGGDELFGGYRRYLGEHYMRWLAALPQPFRRVISRAATHLPSDRHSPVLNALRYARGFLAAADLNFSGRYRSYVSVFGPKEVAELMCANPASSFDPMADAFEHAGSDDVLNRLLSVDARTQLPDDLLLLTDKMSMAVSLECRVPFLDHELVELAAAIPYEAKVRGGHLKYLLKRSLADVLPRDILDRKKRGFGAPMGAWLKSELLRALESVLSRETAARRGLFHFEPIERLIAEHRANRVDGTDRLMALLNLEVWCRLFIDGRSPEDLALELKAGLL